METALSLNNTHQVVTLNDIIPAVRKLPSAEKLRLIRILAEELDKVGHIFPFEPNKVYDLPTPYNSFGVAETLMNTLQSSDK
jgi:hypothetical protein